jgi:predicted alpha/beta-hydrolase family hydrolase
LHAGLRLHRHPDREATLRGVKIATSEGPAHVTLDEPAGGPPAADVTSADQSRDAVPAFLLVLTHGAGGGVEAPDLLAARDAALRLGGTVARVTQPYRVKGQRAPGSAVRQDAAWVEVVMVLRNAVRGAPGTGRHDPADGQVPGIPLIQGGRSNGARVACRTARAVGARAVVALAFPLHPPGRPERSRAAELREAGTAVLVVNGDRDPFGIPDRADATRVVVLAGESHALSRSPEAVADAVGSWLRDVLSAAR